MKDIDKFFHEMFVTDSMLNAKIDSLTDVVGGFGASQTLTNILIGGLICVMIVFVYLLLKNKEMK